MPSKGSAQHLLVGIQILLLHIMSVGFTHSINIFYFFILYFHFFKDFFLMWTIFKVFIEFVTILLLFYVLVSWL